MNSAGEVKEGDVILKAENIHMSFGKVQALSGVDLEIRRGEIHSIIGPNGAGKTVMMNCINGLYRPQQGNIYFKGERINGLSPHKRAELGIGRTFQKLELYGGMTVLDNIRMGSHIHLKSGILSGAIYAGKTKKEEAGMQTKPTAASFKNPAIALELIEVPQYDGYWYYGAKTKPAKGKAGNHGAPLPLAVTFNITNPNSYPVLLDGYKFTIAFEEFDVVTVVGYDTQWIPAGKTNQLRATTMITVRSGLLSLLVTGGFKLKAKGTNAWAALEKWWTTIPDMAFPITIHEGARIPRR